MPVSRNLLAEFIFRETRLTKSKPWTMSLSKISSLLLLPLLVIMLSGPFIVLLLAVQTEPAVTNAPALTFNEISRVEQLLLKSAPQSPSARSEQNLQLNADE